MISKFYDISLTVLSINNFLFLGMYPISSLFVANYIFKKFDLKFSVGVGIVCLLI